MFLDALAVIIRQARGAVGTLGWFLLQSYGVSTQMR